jgi:hypothetical protein
VLREGGVPSHPECGKVDACTVVRSIGLLLREGASGALTYGTEGVAFWTDDGLSFRWRYEQLVSIGFGSGATQTGGGFATSGRGLGGVVGPQLAEFLNKVTTQTVAHSLVHLVMQGTSVMFRTASVPQQRLELDLAPIVGRLGARA